MTRHVALYCRLSPRPDGGYEGVDVQERQGRLYAAAHWPDLPVVVYADAGLSAADGGPRPEFERLREDIRAGRVAHLWTVEQSRLERTEVGWFELAAELDTAGIGEVHTDRDGVVEVSGDVAGIKAVLAAGEIRRLRRRVRDRLDANASAGRPPGATPYGYRHAVTEGGVKTYEVVPEQADVIRDAAGKVLAGWSLANIARHLTAGGLRGPRGGTIDGGAVRSMVTTPAVAGQRLHRGEIVGRGNWPPILEEQTWQACCDRLAGHRVVRSYRGSDLLVPGPGRRRTVRRYLLTGGLAVCDVCKVQLIGGLRPMRRGQVVPYYMCGVKYGGGGCVGMLAEVLERHVLAEVMRKLSTPEFVAALTTDDHAARRDELTGELDELQRKRKRLAGQWGRDELTDDEWQAARDEMAERENRLRLELAEIPPPLGDIDPAALSDPRVVAGMTLDERREMVSMFVTRVRVGKATPPYRGVDVSRVHIDWPERGRRTML